MQVLTRNRNNREHQIPPDESQKPGISISDMPAICLRGWVAYRHEVHVKAFYDKLIDRGKKPLQAIVAVMRKLLHSI